MGRKCICDRQGEMGWDGVCGAPWSAVTLQACHRRIGARTGYRFPRVGRPRERRLTPRFEHLHEARNAGGLVVCVIKTRPVNVVVFA
jgi:hypothetical protein